MDCSPALKLLCNFFSFINRFYGDHIEAIAGGVEAAVGFDIAIMKQSNNDTEAAGIGVITYWFYCFYWFFTVDALNVFVRANDCRNGARFLTTVSSSRKEL